MTFHAGREGVGGRVDVVIVKSLMSWMIVTSYEIRDMSYQ
jgi:hypothetical protein